MKHLAICMILTVMVLATGLAAQEERLYLVKEGKPVSTVVIPNDADQWTITAAEWLSEYVQKASGVELKVVTEDQSPSGVLISVGQTKLAEKADIHTRELKWDGCKLTVKDNVLYLIGRDQEMVTKSHPYVGAKGTCRAVLTFLEDHCGVRWFLPTSMGVVVPTAGDIFVPANLNKTFTPAFAYSDGRSVYDVNILDEPGATPAAMANNYRKSIIVAPGGHTYYHSVSADQYFKDHPEYFAMIDGKRTGNGNHLCSTNPGVKQLMVDWTRMRFDQGVDWQSIGQEDGYRRCECPECDKLDKYRFETAGFQIYEEYMETELRDTPPERLFLLHKAVIDEVKKSHPDKKVVLMCYAPTAWPSKQIPYFGDNVIAEVMHPNPEYIEAWRDKASGLTCKTDWFNTQCPMGFNVHLTPKELADRIRFLHKNNVVGIAQYAEGNWGLQGPLFYELGRLMGDPTLDEKALVAEYCHGVYGQADDTMIEFFSLLYPQVEKVLPISPRDIAANGRNFGMPRRGMSTIEMYLSTYPPSLLDQLELLLKKAEGEADTEQSKGWLRLTRDYFDFNKLLTEALISHQEYQKNANSKNWQYLKERVEAFDAHRTKIINYPKEYTDLWFPGHDVLCKWMTANLEKESTAYYTSWESRKPMVLERGIKGTAMGYGTSYYYAFIAEPLTLDFSKEP